MNDEKTRQLPREITDFCKERSASTATKTKSPKSALHTLLAAFVAVTIVIGAGEPDKSRWTQVMLSG